MKTEEYYELYSDLQDAYRLACRRKNNNSHRIAFELNREENLSELASSILRREYAPVSFSRFIVTEPVVREVIAADFRERVVHHYVDSFLSPWLERILIYDCYSCRKEKGISAGVKRLEHHIRSCSHNYTRACYVLKLDIRSYFMSIDRNILWQKAERLLQWIGRQQEPESGIRMDRTARFRTVAYLTQCIIRNNPLENCVYKGNPLLQHRLPAAKSLAASPPDCGLPIGNLTSQLFSNLYLNSFDHFMKDTLHLKHYGRYVDDFFLVGNNPDALLALVPAIRLFLQADARLELHPDKICLCNVSDGVAFLGSYLKPFRRYVLKKTVARIRVKMKRMNECPTEFFLDKRQRFGALSSVNSYMGIFSQARAYNLRCRLLRHAVLFRYCYATSFYRKLVMKRKWKSTKNQYVNLSL